MVMQSTDLNGRDYLQSHSLSLILLFALAYSYVSESKSYYYNQSVQLGYEPLFHTHGHIFCFITKSFGFVCSEVPSLMSWTSGTFTGCWGILCY